MRRDPAPAGSRRPPDLPIHARLIDFILSGTALALAPTYPRSVPPDTKLVAVATDGSAGAALAVEWAATFARSLDADLLAIQVIAPNPEPAEVDASGDDDGAPDVSEASGAAAPERTGASSRVSRKRSRARCRPRGSALGPWSSRETTSPP